MNKAEIVKEVLTERRSVRGFTSEKISEEAIEMIINAALTAPLAMGDAQTTHLTVVNDPEIAEEIRSAAMLKSRTTGEPVDPFYGAQTFFFVSATDLSEDNIEFCNAGCVIENMMIQATALGLGSCYIWGCLRKLKKHPEVLEKLHLPAGYEILSALAVGYRDPEYVCKDRSVMDYNRL
ncbi:MAG: nitroreductase family protein [Lachnospiraceae bacterium]|nr:nitroreductase family protein [Lachnospiraceae bacterium]